MNDKPDSVEMSTGKYVLHEIGYVILWIILYILSVKFILGYFLSFLIELSKSIPFIIAILNYANWIVGGLGVVILSTLYALVALLPSEICKKIYLVKHSIVSVIILWVFVIINVVFAVIVLINAKQFDYVWYTCFFGFVSVASIAESNDGLDRIKKLNHSDEEVETYVSYKKFKSQRTKTIVAIVAACLILVYAISETNIAAQASEREKDIESYSSGLESQIDDLKADEDALTEKYSKAQDSYDAMLKQHADDESYKQIYQNIVSMNNQGKGSDYFYVDRNIIIMEKGSTKYVYVTMTKNGDSASALSADTSVSANWDGDFDSRGKIKLKLIGEEKGSSIVTLESSKDSYVIKVLVVVI